MRVRSSVSGGFDTVVHRRQYVVSSPGATPTLAYSSDTAGGLQKMKTITDVQTPGFNRIRQCGKFLPLNPVTIRTITEERTPGVNTYERKLYWNSTVGFYLQTFQDPGNEWFVCSDPGLGAAFLGAGSWDTPPPDIYAVPPYDESVVSYVSNAAIADVKSATWDALTSLAEARETVGLLAVSARRLKKAAVFIAKKASRKGILRSLRKAKFSQLWLEGRYGWMPAVYDMQDIVATIQSKIKAGDLVRGRSRQVIDLNSTSVHTYTSPNRGTIVVRVVTTGKRTYRGKAYAHVEHGMPARVGVDPLVSGWELTKFSFIFDWAVDIGSWIQAWSPFSGSKLDGCMVSVKDEYTTTAHVLVTFERNVPNSEIWSGSASSSIKLQIEEYNRFQSGISLPRLNPRITFKRVTDLVSILLGGRDEVGKILGSTAKGGPRRLTRKPK